MRKLSAVRNLALTLAFAAMVPLTASGQASETAERKAEITPFAMATIIDPDYGPHSNLGVIVGIDYTRLFFHSRLQPSIEARYTNATGTAIDENAFLGGLKLATPFGRLTPYATLLVGAGNIKFVGATNGYITDTATVYSLGAGADLNLTHSFRVRADYTHQSWNCDPLTLTPVSFSVGLVYRLGFHGHGLER